MRDRVILPAMVGLFVALAPATAADAAPRLEVSDTTGLDDGQVVTVTGSGYDESKGIYVALCVEPEPGRPPSPCLGGVDSSGQSGSSAWISSDPPPYGEELAQPYEPGGSFTVQLTLRASDEHVDCRQRQCGVATRADHTRSSDRSQDVFVPVTFVGGTPPPPPPPPTPSPEPSPSSPPAPEPTTAAAPTPTAAATDSPVTPSRSTTPDPSPTDPSPTDTAPSPDPAPPPDPTSSATATPMPSLVAVDGKGTSAGPWWWGGAALVLVVATAVALGFRAASRDDAP